jgi:malate dehydrogenase (oxaloacetate-decarboxylating)(NADP+)
VRADAIVATGRSDYANQGQQRARLPYIFRGALDVRARTINDQMKIAAAEARRACAQDVPDEVDAALTGRRLRFRPDYIIPCVRSAPDSAIPAAVAKAAMDSGVARRPIIDMDEWRRSPSGSIPRRRRCISSSSVCTSIRGAWCSPRARRSA